MYTLVDRRNGRIRGIKKESYPDSKVFRIRKEILVESTQVQAYIHVNINSFFS